MIGPAGKSVTYWQGVRRKRQREQVGRCKSHLTFASEHILQDLRRKFRDSGCEHLRLCRLREDSAAFISQAGISSSPRSHTLFESFLAHRTLQVIECGSAVHHVESSRDEQEQMRELEVNNLGDVERFLLPHTCVALVDNFHWRVGHDKERVSAANVLGVPRCVVIATLFAARPSGQESSVWSKQHYSCNEVWNI
jgi:hypothetical protein